MGDMRGLKQSYIAIPSFSISEYVATSLLGSCCVGLRITMFYEQHQPISIYLSVTTCFKCEVAGIPLCSACRRIYYMNISTRLRKADFDKRLFNSF